MRKNIREYKKIKNLHSRVIIRKVKSQTVKQDMSGAIQKELQIIVIGTNLGQANPPLWVKNRSSERKGARVF